MILVLCYKDGTFQMWNSIVVIYTYFYNGRSRLKVRTEEDGWSTDINKIKRYELRCADNQEYMFYDKLMKMAMNLGKICSCPHITGLGSKVYPIKRLGKFCSTCGKPYTSGELGR